MRLPFTTLLVVVPALISTSFAFGQSSDGQVFQVQLPKQDISVSLLEAPSGCTVRLQTESASVEGQRMYVGDGKVAIDLMADPNYGIYLQGVKFQGSFKNGSTIKLRPGYFQAANLQPGTVYVTLPGLTFELPEK